MRKNWMYLLLALCATVFYSCKEKSNEPEVVKFNIVINVSDIKGTSANVQINGSDATRYAAMTVTETMWNQIKQEYSTPEQQNKALIAEYKSSVVPMTDDEFDANCCANGEVKKALTGLAVSTTYAVVAFAYSTDKVVGNESFVYTFTTTDERPKDLQFETVEIKKFSASFRAIPQDTTKFFYINLYEKGYVEETFAGGLITTEKEFNESEIGMLEYTYYYTNGSEATPYQLATTYMHQGVYEYQFSGLTKNTEYTMIGFFYDYEADEAGDVLYRMDFKTLDGTGTKDYPVDMTITLEWVGTTLKATPSDTLQAYYFDATFGSVASQYATADELAEAMLEYFGGSIPASSRSYGKDSYSFDGMCEYYSGEDTVVGFAFGVDGTGKICSQPVKLELANPYYGEYSYDYYTPSRRVAQKGKMTWK